MIFTRSRGGLRSIFLRASAPPRDALHRCFQGGRLKSVHQLTDGFQRMDGYGHRRLLKILFFAPLRLCARSVFLN